MDKTQITGWPIQNPILLHLLMWLQFGRVLCQSQGRRFLDEQQVILGFPAINCSTRWPLVSQRACKVSIGPPAAPGVLPLAHCYQRSLGKSNASVGRVLGRWGLAVAFWGYISWFVLIFRGWRKVLVQSRAFTNNIKGINIYMTVVSVLLIREILLDLVQTFCSLGVHCVINNMF